jgi:hypothetical protein
VNAATYTLRAADMDARTRVPFVVDMTIVRPSTTSGAYSAGELPKSKAFDADAAAFTGQ